MSKAVRMYTDGSCLGNPGPGGYGVVLKYDGKDGEALKEYSQGYKNTTNNRMELMAVIKGLEALTRPCAVEIDTDSQYVKKAFTDGWLKNWKKNGWKTAAKKPVKNKELWVQLDELLAGHQVSWHWVKGHAGHPENERCDVLARTAASSGDLLPDT